MFTWIATVRPHFVTAALAVAVLGSLAPRLHAADEALRPVFNGKDLSGFKVPDPNPYWRVERGVLIGQSDEKMTGSMLLTEKSYGDFIWEAEARWQGDPDSGVFFRTPQLQVQIGTSISQKRDLTGSFYLGKKGYPEEYQAKEAAKYLKKGDWNTIRVEARGTTFTVFINGHRVSQYTDEQYAKPGPIGVQIHQKLNMKIEFRNIKVAELR
ncbi:MAG TPA: DUF1080 domain-containing protein [Opitutaceae bacterium]|nr:DUF1080 domain-containing protein [Opitutaceae bacterium]